MAADQQRAAAGWGIPCFLRNVLTAAAQMKQCSSSNTAAATQWLWQQGSGTGSDSGCLSFALVTHAVGVAGVGVAAKEMQQLTPQQLTQRSWPQFSIVRRGGSGAGRKGAARRQQCTAGAQGRAERICALAAVVQQLVAQQRSGSGSSSSGSSTVGSSSGTAAAAQGRQQWQHWHSGQRQRRSSSGAWGRQQW